LEKKKYGRFKECKAGGEKPRRKKKFSQPGEPSSYKESEKTKGAGAKCGQ